MIVEFQIRQHSRVDVTCQFTNLNPCIIHGRKPTVLCIVSGRRKDIAFYMGCDSEDCYRITSERDDVEKTWNKFNPQGIENHSI